MQLIRCRPPNVSIAAIHHYFISFIALIRRLKFMAWIKISMPKGVSTHWVSSHYIDSLSKQLWKPTTSLDLSCLLKELKWIKEIFNSLWLQSGLLEVADPWKYFMTGYRSKAQTKIWFQPWCNINAYAATTRSHERGGKNRKDHKCSFLYINSYALKITHPWCNDIRLHEQFRVWGCYEFVLIKDTMKAMWGPNESINPW